MKRASIFFFLAVIITLLSGCATAPAPVPETTPQSNRFLVDPRIGFTAQPSKSTAKNFETGWQLFQSGRLLEAEAKFSAIEKREPGYLPAALGLAAIALQRGQLDPASQWINRTSGTVPYLAADVYRAELARARGDLPDALQIYQSLQSVPDRPSTVDERIGELRKSVFEMYYAQATQTQSAPEAIGLLQKALEIAPDATAARLLLTQRLIAERRYDEASTQATILVNAGEGTDDALQEALAEIDAGRGRYQEAISRYEKLLKKTPDPRFRRRLAEIKDAWNEANMPPQYLRAVESQAITRGDLAVLVYWRVGAVRFATGIGEPPIAVDIGEVAGREELVRALALRLYNVDPITRRVDPFRPITGTAFVRMIGKIIALRGAPSCAAPSPPGTPEVDSIVMTLDACAISLGEIRSNLDAPVTGREAVAVLERLDEVLSGK